MSNHTFDNGSQDFIDGQQAGYMGFTYVEGLSDDYNAGYAAGETQWADDQAASQEQADRDSFYSDVEMGMYDDDPNPYHGDYSEM